MVTTGADRHRKNSIGKVLRIIRGIRPGQDKVIVEGMNIHKKHVRPSQQHQQGGIIEMEMPIHISNVMPVVDGKPTRVRFETLEDGSKVRIAARGDQAVGAELRKAKS